MPDCTSQETQRNFMQGPMSGTLRGGPHQQYGHQGAPAESARVAADLDSLYAAHDEMTANIRRLTQNGAVSPGFKPTAGMFNQIRSMASAEAREYALVLFDSRARAIADNERVMTRLNLSETSESNLWLRLRTNMNEGFVDDTARLQSYFLNMFGEKGGRSADQNIGVATVVATVSELRGRAERYERYVSDMLKKVYRTMGRHKDATPVDAMRDIMTVATQDVVRQWNDVLIQRWETVASRARDARIRAEERSAKAAAAGNAERAKLYQRQANALQGTFDHYKALASELRKRRGETSVEWIDSKGGSHKTLCCGWLDGEIALEADAAWKRLESYGFSEAHVNELIGDAQELYRMVERSLVRNNQVSLRQLGRFPDIRGFLPLVQDKHNAGDLATAITVFTPGSLHAKEGTTERPANAWDSLLNFAKRGAYRVSMTKLAQLLYNAHRVRGEEASGIRVTEWRKVASLSRKDYARFMRATSSGGIVSDIVNAKGEVERVFVRFRPDFKSSDGGQLYTGVKLNEVLNGLTRRSDSLNLIGKGTAITGMMYTRFNPGFPLINSMRDALERMYNMSNRDYVDEQGRVIPGYKLVPSMIANSARALRIAADASWGRGKPDLSTKEGQWLDEYRRFGLDAIHLKDLGKEYKSFDESLDPNSSTMANGVPYIKEAAKGMGRYGGYLVKALDGWNSTLNNAPALAQYFALREHGVSAMDAGTAVAEMLNSNLTGTWTSALRTLFPFVRPTMQGARALLRSIGLASDAQGKFNFKPRNFAMAVTAYAAASSLYAFFRDGLGEAEDGTPNMDAISVGTLATAMPFMPNGEGGYFKVPIPFGMSRIAFALAAGQDRVERGVMSPEDMAFAVISTLGKQVAPSDFPEWSMRENPADWLMQAFAPALIRPIADVGVNRNFAGGPIVRGSNQGEESMEPKSSKGYAATEQWYKDAAKTIFDTTGFDLAPEQVKALMRGYLGGPLKAITAIVESDNPAATEERQSSVQDLGWFLTALGGTMYYGKLRDADKSLVYGAMDKMRRDVRREGVEWNNPELAKKRDPDAYRAWRVQQLRDKGWSEAKLADLDLILQIDSALRKSRQNWKEPLMQAFHADDEGTALKEAFNQKFDEEYSIFRSGVENLNLYHGGWE